jgi:hypothetical protein
MGTESRLHRPPRDPRQAAVEPVPPLADAGPVVVCLNQGWGGAERLDEALGWSRRTGSPLTAVFVMAERGTRRALRAATRAMDRARARGAVTGVPIGEAVVGAPSVPDGLLLAARALGGRVGVGVREVEHRAELERVGVPLVEVGW